MSEGKTFFQTLPGILTGLAALIGAVTGLYLALQGNPTPDPPIPTPAPIDNVETRFTREIQGLWTNADPDTRDITRIEVLRRDGRFFTHAWGKCHPQDCDWGEARGRLEGELLKVNWHWSGGERAMSIRLKGEFLEAETISTYHDDRPPRRSLEAFIK